MDYTEKISADLKAETTSGDVRIKLPADSEFEIDFNATSGNAKCDFPIVVNGTQDENKLGGKVGNGGSRIAVDSISGGLEITKK